MLFKLVDAIVGYVKESPAWPVLRPVFALLSLYVTALVLVYQFVEWQYRLSPPVSLFLRSYLVKQVTVVCVAIVLILTCALSRDLYQLGPPRGDSRPRRGSRPPRGRPGDSACLAAAP